MIWYITKLILFLCCALIYIMVSFNGNGKWNWKKDESIAWFMATVSWLVNI